MAQPVKTPIERSLIDRITGAVRFVTTGQFPSGWFGPGQPIAPVAPEAEVAGRRFDFPVAVNTRYTPRQGEAVSFFQMRALADACDVLRLVIETRKDQMARMAWKIVPTDPAAQADPRCAAATAFFQCPDKEHGWSDWLRMLLEDLFVIDAPTLYPRRTLGGDLYALEPIDGATIKRVIDEFGRTPVAPYPAYQQVLHGMPAVDYTRDELIYRPRNLRTSRLYGFGPTEQIITTINIALRRAMNQLSYYTEGNTPNLVFGVPPEWNPDQIAQFQSWWDTLNAGESKHAARFVPSGVKPFNTHEGVLKDEFDEWLARIVCFAFSIAPTPFIKSNNRATAQTSHEQSVTEGTQPLQAWVKSVIDNALQRPDLLNMPGLEFLWSSDDDPDPQVQAEITDKRLRNGSMTIDEARSQAGDDPLPDGIGAKPLIYTGAGAVLLESILNPPPVAPVVAGPVANTPQDGIEPSEPAAVEPAAKFEKKKEPGPIDHERLASTSAAKAIEKALTEFFDRARANIADQITAALNKVAKAGGENDALAAAHASRVEEILAALDLASWDDVPDELKPILMLISKDGAREALLQLGIDDSDMIGLANDGAVAYAEKRAAEMVGKRMVGGKLVQNPNAKWRIDEPTREMVRADVSEAMAGGWSNDELKAKLKDNYAFSSARAETIARTETAKADMAGTIAGWKASDVVSGRKWLAAPDCCDICQEIDGEVADLDGDYPSGADGVPLHPNCRCVEIPVMAGEENDE